MLVFIGLIQTLELLLGMVMATLAQMLGYSMKQRAFFYESGVSTLQYHPASLEHLEILYDPHNPEVM